MEKFSDILTDTTITARRQTGTTSSMHQPGLMEGGVDLGKLTKRTNSQVEEKRQQDRGGESAEAWEVKLDAILSMCFDTFKAYGKTYDQMDNISRAFKLVLMPYSTKQIQDAFAKHLSTGDEMPTPKDIVAIIDPSTQPRKWSATAFMDIKRRQREGQFISKEEADYCENYIKAQLEGARVGERESAIKHVALEDKSYWSGA